ncbi:type II secretion system F family protein [Candidatus Dojkabacteria bacterium]|nr:type II secretion system F family protein [Candidatus Dojkabacteria bacterium]
MKKFEYSARTPAGAIQRGEIESDSRTKVVRLLQERDLIVVNVSEKVSMIGSLSEINVGGVPIDEKVIFMRQLATMVSSGLPLTQSLEILSVQAKNPKFKKVLKAVLNDVEGGSSLANSFKKHKGVFDDVVLNLIKAGEDSGKLEEIFLKLADELEHKRDFQNKVKSAMIYPIVILVVIVIVVGLVMVFMIPNVSDIYGEFGGDLPPITKVLVSISDFVREYWWIVLIVLAGLAAGIKYYIDSPGGRKVFDNFVLKIPIFGDLTTKTQLAQFTQTFHLLITSGLPILDALDLVANSLSNSWFRDAISQAAKEVEKGSSLALPISRSDVFPLIVSQMIGVGEETGKLDDVLEKMSEYYNTEVNIMANNLANIMEPLMLIIMAVVIGFIAVAVYMPLFSLANVVQ